MYLYKIHSVVTNIEWVKSQSKINVIQIKAHIFCFVLYENKKRKNKLEKNKENK